MRKMAAALRGREVGEKEFRCYAGLYILAVAFWIYGMVFQDTTDAPLFIYIPAYLEYVELGITLIATAGTFFVAWKANKSGDNADFWYRFFSISFPIGITTVVLAFVTGVTLVMLGIISSETSGYIDTLVITVLMVLSIYWMHKYMKLIAQPEHT